MNFQSTTNLLKANVEALANCKRLVHLRVDGCPHTSYPEFAKLGTLKCLELEPGIYSWRGREPDEEPDSDDEKNAAALEAETGFRNLPGIIGGMLGKLHGLQELAVDLETGCTYFRNDAGEFVNPHPIGVEDLVRCPSLYHSPTEPKLTHRNIEISD